MTQAQIAKWIHDTREAQGLTLRELAARISRSYMSIHRMETGESDIRMPQLNEVARALGYAIHLRLVKASEDRGLGQLIGAAQIVSPEHIAFLTRLAPTLQHIPPGMADDFLQFAESC